MEQEIIALKNSISSLSIEVEQLKTLLREQKHDGVDGGSVYFNSLDGLITVVTSAAELTAKTASVGRRVGEQVFIHYNSTGPVWKLYLYDSVNGVWKNVTIA